jgi:uncharacterized protein
MPTDDKPFTVRIRELPTTRRFEVTAPFVEAALRGLPLYDILGAPTPDPDAGAGVAELELYADGDTVFANGPFTGHLHVACSRCLEAARLDLDEALRVTFLPAAKLPPPPPEVVSPDPAKAARAAKAKAAEAKLAAEDDLGDEVSIDDVDVFPYDGETIDLEPLFREQFVLAIPYAPLCREDCLGLCAQCGINRNQGTCACEKPIDPRLAALKGLKLPS